MSDLEILRLKLYECIDNNSAEEILKISHELDQFILEEMKNKHLKELEKSE